MSGYKMDADERAIWKCAMGGEMSMSYAIGWAIRHGRTAFADLLRRS